MRRPAFSRAAAPRRRRANPEHAPASGLAGATRGDFPARLRFCAACGARVPWGTPQCLECGAHTAWRRLLALFGLIVGAGTAAVVLAVVARVWLLPPPQPIRDLAFAQDFLNRVGQTADGALVSAAGRCADGGGAALCVRLSSALDGAAREALRARLQSLLRPGAGVERIVFVEAGGG